MKGQVVGEVRLLMRGATRQHVTSTLVTWQSGVEERTRLLVLEYARPDSLPREASPLPVSRAGVSSEGRGAGGAGWAETAGTTQNIHGKSRSIFSRSTENGPAFP